MYVLYRAFKDLNHHSGHYTEVQDVYFTCNPIHLGKQTLVRTLSVKAPTTPRGVRSRVVAGGVGAGAHPGPDYLSLPLG